MTSTSIYILLIHENDQENFNEGMSNYEKYYVHTSVDLIYNISNLSIDNITKVFKDYNVTVTKSGGNSYFINFTQYWDVYREINSYISEKGMRTNAFIQDRDIFSFYFYYCSEDNVVENTSEFYNVTEHDRKLLEELVEIVINIFQVEFGLQFNDIKYNTQMRYPDGC